MATVAKVRQFDTGVAQNTQETRTTSSTNIVPDIPRETVADLAASAPVRIKGKPGNPRQRRYRQKTYSLLQKDIDLIEGLVLEIRQGGLYERGRSDVVRAGVRLLNTLSREEKLQAIQAVESLKD